MHVWIRTTALVATFALAGGCYSSKYMPRSSGRVSMVIQDNKLVYVRDGRVYPHGFLGKGLIDAVRGNPAAERSAREYYNRQKNGLLVTLGGLLCAGTALGVATYKIAREEERFGQAGDPPVTELLVSAACLIVGYAGLFHIASAAPHRFDAINIFNDSSNRYFRGPPGYRDPYGRPVGSSASCETRTDRERNPLRCAHRAARR